MYLTGKQIALLKIVVEGNGNDLLGKFIAVDLDQVLERLPYRTSKQSLQFSIRALVKKEVIKKESAENRRGRSRVLLSPTLLGRRVFRAEVDPCFVEDEDSEPQLHSEPGFPL